jgi:hypothetical protein
MNFAVTAFRLKLILSRLLPDNSEGTTPAIGSGSPSSGAMYALYESIVAF